MRLSSVAVMEAGLFMSGARFIHLSPSASKALEAQQAFLDALNRLFLVDRVTEEEMLWSAHFRPCELIGAAVEHVPVVIFEDYDELDVQAREEAKFIASNTDGFKGAIVKV